MGDMYVWNTMIEKNMSADVAASPQKPKQIPVFDDDFSSIVNMDALRELVASVTEEVEPDFDMKASYAKVNLNEVVRVEDVIPVPPRKGLGKPLPRKGGKPRECFGKHAETKSPKRVVREEDENMKPKVNMKPKPKRVREENKVNMKPKPKRVREEGAVFATETSEAAQKFLQLFVRGALAKKPVKWTAQNMETLAKKLRVCPRFVQVGRQYAIQDVEGVFHPTEALIRKWKNAV